MIMILSAVAVLLCTALFSVTFAKWTVNSSGKPVDVTAQAGQFYVDYPQYVTSSGLDIPDLDKDTYYLQVQKSGGISEYYAMKENTGNTDEKMLTNVKLDANTTLDIYKGLTHDKLKKTKKTGSATQFSVNSDGTTMKVSSAGYYDFYYEFGNGNIYVSFTTDTKYTIPPERDRSMPSAKVIFGDGPVVFRLDNTLNTKISTAHFYIWGKNSYDQEQNNIWPGVELNKNADKERKNGSTDRDTNIYQFGIHTNEVTGILMNDNGSSQTGDGDTFYKMYIPGGLQPNHTYTFKIYGDFGWNFGQWSDSFWGIDDKVTDTAPTVVNRDDIAPKPDCTGATDIKNIKLKGEVDVRDVNATSTSTYHNYVNVSRVGGTGETLAYVNFQIIADDAALNTGLVSFKVNRAVTDGNGAPNGATASELVINDPSGKTLGDINWRLPTEEEKKGNGQANDDYIIGGAYILLYFGTGVNQYYALDVEIETADEVSFRLIASANNEDRRNKFEVGYGEKYGYYLGGEFNGVGMWEPREAAHLTASSDTKVDDVKLTYYDKLDPDDENATKVEYKGPSYIDVTIDITLTAANDTVKLFRLNGVDGKREGGTNPTLWFVPRNIHKNYTGGAGDNGTPLYNGDMNIIIRNKGTYRIRYVGNIEYRYSNDIHGTNTSIVAGYDRKENKFMSKANYDKLTASQKAETVVDTGRENVAEPRYVELGNWNGVVDHLYVTRLDNGDVADFDVTFDANGGAWGEDKTTTVKVSWGGNLDAPENPTRAGYRKVDGWFTAAEGGSAFNFNQIVTSAPGTLYAHWERTADVFYHLNDGSTDDADIYRIVDSVSGNKLERPAEPTRDGYVFIGWFTDKTSGDFWNFDTKTYSTGDKLDLYARWIDPNAYTGRTVVFINGVANDLELEGGEYYTVVELEPSAELRVLVNGSVPTYTSGSTGVTKNGSDNFATSSLSKNQYKITYNTSTNVLKVEVNVEETFTVTFDIDDGLMASGESTTQTVVKNKTATRPSDPTRLGYDFVDWVTTKNGSTSFDFANTKITTDTTVYAKWSIINYKIDYQNLGESTRGENPEYYNVELGTNGVLQLQNPGNVSNRHFKEWTSGKENGDTITHLKPDMVIGKSKTDTIPLYANFYYTITFDANGGSVSQSSADTDTDGKLTLSALPTPTRKHYTFNGWFTASTGGTSVTIDKVYDKDTTIYAQWNGLVYTITFDANGGTFSGGSTTTTINTTIGTGKLPNLPTSNPTRDFYNFSAWYTTSATTGGTQITTNYEFEPTSGTTAVTVYARWNIKSAGLYINGQFKASMTTNTSNSAEQMVTGIDLSVNDKIDIIYGGNVVTYNRNTSSTSYVTYNTSTQHYTVNTAFMFDFYYNTSSQVLYIGIPAYLRVNGNDGTYAYLYVSDKDSLNRNLGLSVSIYTWASGTDGTTWPGINPSSGGTVTSIKGSITSLNIICTINNGGSQTSTYSKPTTGSWTSGGVYRITILYNDNFTYNGGISSITKV
ncbi:MAG: InlB B-repeat-containing protein [Clostridiales bacterium]|nr:InlB B-repeat-containing protein [Clostridiales bacterium]